MPPQKKNPELGRLLDSFRSARDPKVLEAYASIVDAEIEKRRAANPLKYFIPNGKIEEVVRAIGDHKAEKRWVFVMPAANSVGKTAAAVAVLGNIIWGPQNKYFDHPEFRDWTYPKKFWYISEHSTLKDFVCGVDESIEGSEIRKWFPPGRYQFTKGGLEFFSRLTTDNGWTGSFKTYDQDMKQFESDKIGVAIFDEPPPEQVFNAVVARLTLGGIIIMPMTPLTHSAWVKDRLIDNAGPGTGIFVLYADIESNCKEHGIRGRLDHEQIQRIIDQYDEEEREARAHGRFAHMTGLVYKSLHPSIHRHERQPAEFTQDTHRIYCIQDPHDRRPPIIAWVAVDQYDNTWVVDEFPDHRMKPFHLVKDFTMTTRDVARIIMEKEQANGWSNPGAIKRVMDPNFGRKQIQAVGKTVQELFAAIGREMGYPLSFDTNVNDNIEAGHRIVKDFMYVNADGDTRFRVGVNCPNVWYQLTHYTYVDRTGKRADIDGPGNKVAQKFKDGADVIRYFFAFFRPPLITRASDGPPRTYSEYMDRNVFAKIHERSERRKLSRKTR